VKAKHRFEVIDSHTGGNPTRLALSGIPEVPGKTMSEKMAYFQKNHDWIRTAMVLEPRGGNLTSSAVLVPPCDPRADIGIFFMEPFGYPPMCGSDTIGLVTMLIESGRIPAAQPTTTVRIDTPAGLVEATARVSAGVVEDVTFANVTAFVAALDAEITVDGYGSVTADIAYGGNFYVIADAAQFGLTLQAHDTAPAIAAARSLLAAANDIISAQHPVDRTIKGITHVQFFGPAHSEGADARIMVIIEPGIVDRSPCGTGTTAKVATLMQRGLMAVGDTFTHESVTGGRFTGTAVETTALGDQKGYRVAITGQAYITAESTIIVDPRDPLGHGFLVN
jgi:proline racemase